MMKIDICPSTLQEGYDSYSPIARKKLFDGKNVSPFLDFDFERNDHCEKIVDNMKGISVSGVQEKTTAIIKQGKILLANKGEVATHLLKPVPQNYNLFTRKQMPANEHLTMQIASQVYGIITAENGLCFDSNNQAVYITKRFDVTPDGSKVAIEDFATLLGKNEQTDGKDYKYDGCYEDIALAIKRYIPAWPVAMDRFFKLIIFNYIYGNENAHLKNFSIIRRGNDSMLAPAYGLMNTRLHVNGNDLALNGCLQKSGWKSEVYKQTGHPCLSDFIAFGKQINLAPSRLNSTISSFLSIPDKMSTLVGNSYLNDKMKQNYLRVVEEKTKHFLRISEH